ncbi:hypothetical protein PAMP_023315 [Pampus punctatissimus]
MMENGGGKAVNESGAVFQTNHPHRGDKEDKERTFFSNWIHIETLPLQDVNLNSFKWTTERSQVYLTHQKLLQYRTTLSCTYCTAAFRSSKPAKTQDMNYIQE